MMNIQRSFSYKCSNLFVLKEEILLNLQFTQLGGDAQIYETLLEYGRLSTLSELSEREADRLAEILEQANHDRFLDFWIVEIDHIVGHYLGELEETERQSYKNQKALLREHCGDFVAQCLGSNCLPVASSRS